MRLALIEKSGPVASFGSCSHRQSIPILRVDSLFLTFTMSNILQLPAIYGLYPQLLAMSHQLDGSSAFSTENVSQCIIEHIAAQVI